MNRLDEVLSKFEFIDGEFLYKNWLGYDEQEKVFWFNAIDEKKTQTYETVSVYIELSLDTVESLLKNIKIYVDGEK